MNNSSLILKIMTSLLILSFIGPSISLAQESSEQFIPIGQSPGISDRVSYIGKITAVNSTDNSLLIDSNRGSRLVKITPTTRIWLDRSKKNQTNTAATDADFKVGLMIEVKHIENDETIADWVKIEPG